MRLATHFGAVAGLLAVTAVAPAYGEDYTKITDAAYCAGVVARNIDLVKKFGGLAPERGDAQVLARLVAVVGGAIKMQKIDIGTANKLISVGHEDAQLCWDISERCMNEAAKRTEDKNADLDRSQRIHDNCQSRGEAVCKRVEACN